jgi:hypothetical protein
MTRSYSRSRAPGWERSSCHSAACIGSISEVILGPFPRTADRVFRPIWGLFARPGSFVPIIVNV